MNVIRFLAILVGFGILFPLEFWLHVPWYVAVPLGILGYFLIRYAGWAINERRRLNQERDRVLKEVMRDPGAQNSN